MTDKINDLTTSIGAERSAPVAPVRAVARGMSTTTAAGEGDVHITDTATHLAALEQAVRNLPPVDPVRVAELRSAIEQGRYTVKPAHIASQLLQLEQALAAAAGGASSPSAAAAE